MGTEYFASIVVGLPEKDILKTEEVFESVPVYDRYTGKPSGVESRVTHTKYFIGEKEIEDGDLYGFWEDNDLEEYRDVSDNVIIGDRIHRSEYCYEEINLEQEFLNAMKKIVKDKFLALGIDKEPKIYLISEYY